MVFFHSYVSLPGRVDSLTWIIVAMDPRKIVESQKNLVPGSHSSKHEKRGLRASHDILEMVDEYTTSHGL